jgi:hypothetical protein
MPKAKGGGSRKSRRNDEAPYESGEINEEALATGGSGGSGSGSGNKKQPPKSQQGNKDRSKQHSDRDRDRNRRPDRDSLDNHRDNNDNNRRGKNNNNKGDNNKRGGSRNNSTKKNNIDFKDINTPCLTFDDMKLKDDLLKGIYAYGFEKPSAIQQRAIKPIVLGRDVIAQSQSVRYYLTYKLKLLYTLLYLYFVSSFSIQLILSFSHTHPFFPFFYYYKYNKYAKSIHQII